MARFPSDKRKKRIRQYRNRERRRYASAGKFLAYYQKAMLRQTRSFMRHYSLLADEYRWLSEAEEGIITGLTEQ